MSFAPSAGTSIHWLMNAAAFLFESYLEDYPAVCVGCLGQCWWWGRLMENSWVKTDQTSGKPSSWKLRHVKIIFCEQWPNFSQTCWTSSMLSRLVCQDFWLPKFSRGLPGLSCFSSKTGFLYKKKQMNGEAQRGQHQIIIIGQVFFASFMTTQDDWDTGGNPPKTAWKVGS